MRKATSDSLNAVETAVSTPRTERSHSLRTRSAGAQAEAASMQHLRELEAQINAIRRSQGVIEFSLDGIVTYANDNFFSTLGYTADEIVGKPHRLLVDPDFARSSDYQVFWDKLRSGSFITDEYLRIGKGGRRVWIQATYNPLLDSNGRPYKVVKFAYDVTAQVNMREERKRIEERDRAAAEDLRVRAEKLMHAVALAAKGDLTCEIEVAGDDSFGKLANSFRQLLSDLRLSISSINQTALAVAASSEELSIISQRLTENSQDVATKAQGAAKVSDEVSSNVSVVAASAEEMLVSIREISRSSTEAARVARTAVTMASDTNTTISKLGESSQEIGKVLKVITSIAQQTNLLALNATIEAARAGEAGKGFAVVANEVKELAKETARATEEIGQKIDAIQGNTSAAIRAIGEVSGIINQVNDISGTIASAVEEQTATTNEIGQNVASAAQGTSQISQNITRVAQGTEDAATSARDTQEAALGLAKMAAEMQSMVARFTF